MLKRILIGLAIFALGFVLYVASRPGDMKISRELLIYAPPESIFPFINNSAKANDWMPWKESDPGAVMNYFGPNEGVGSGSRWDSKGKMGTGEALVVESLPNQSVKTQLTYTKPMKMSQLAEITLTSQGSGTMVRWSVSGKNSFLCKFMSVFINMDQMIGGEFEKGLQKLKHTLETSKPLPTDSVLRPPSK